MYAEDPKLLSEILATADFAAKNKHKWKNDQNIAVAGFAERAYAQFVANEAVGQLNSLGNFGSFHSEEYEVKL